MNEDHANLATVGACAVGLVSPAPFGGVLVSAALAALAVHKWGRGKRFAPVVLGTLAGANLLLTSWATRRGGGLVPVGLTDRPPPELIAGNYRILPGFNPEATSATLPRASVVLLRFQASYDREAPVIERTAAIVGASSLGYTASLYPEKLPGVPDFFELDGAHIAKIVSVPPQP